MIRDEQIEVEVHPAIAEHPFVFFRDEDEFVARIEELRGHLTLDRSVTLHSELLVAADRWQRGGRRPDLLLPSERNAEARAWLAEASTGEAKPSSLLVEFIHGSRRVQPTSGRPVSTWLAFGAAGVIAFIAAFFILQAIFESQAQARVAAEATSTAEAELALTSAVLTAASNSAVSVIDEIAATAEAVRLTALAQASEATALAAVTQTAQYAVDLQATNARATQVFALERDAEGRRLLDEADTILNAGDAQLALALAWAAKDSLDDPKGAYRLLRRALTTSESKAINDVATLKFHPDGGSFAIVPRTGDRVQIYDSDTWTLQHELKDQAAPITVLAYSRDGTFLITGAEDGEIVIRAGADGEPRERLMAHQSAVTAVALDAAAGRLVSAGSEPLLAHWDLETGERLASYAAADDETLRIDKLIVTEDGGRIIGWSNDGGVLLMRQREGETLELISAEDGAPVYRGTDRNGRIRLQRRSQPARLPWR